jgi:hypothetical protein
LNVLTCYQLTPGWWRGGPLTGRVDGDGDTLLPAGGLQMWVDRRGTGWTPLAWRDPEPAHVEAAGQLVDKYLLQPAAALEAAVADGCDAGGASATDDPVGHKQGCQALISGLSGCLMGLMGRLEDFQDVPGAAAAGAGGSSGGVPLYPIGKTGATVGRPQARTRVACALARVIQ